MNLTVLIILVVTVVLVLVVVLPKVRGVSRSERTTVERRSGRDRRQRKVRVPVNRRKRARRADDAAKDFVRDLTE
jgi:hypothetical protein